LKIKNAISYILKNGLKITIAKVFEKVSIILYGNKISKQIFEANEYYKLYYPHILALKYYLNDDAPKRINLVVPLFNESTLFGGIATCLIIVTKTAVFLDLPLRIIIRNENDSEAYINYDNFIDLFKLKKPKEIIFHYENKNAVDISRTDIFFASSWWTAYAIRQISCIKRFFHIIQEAENLFYANDYNHLLCCKILNDDQIDFIVNSHYLFEYFKINFPNIYKNGVAFEPAFPLFNAMEFKKKTRYKLFFYARPNYQRNLFFFGLKILEKSIDLKIINPLEWDIYFLGEDLPVIIFPEQMRSINLGMLSWEKYKEFLLDVDLALSLMYTPHPSYPPFDVAASGGVVLTNKYLNKIDFPYDDNIILSDLDEDIMLENMKKAIALAQNSEERKKNYDNCKIPRSWEISLKPIMEFIEDKDVLF
jgi:hypothetical protein